MVFDAHSPTWIIPIFTEAFSCIIFKGNRKYLFLLYSHDDSQSIPPKEIQDKGPSQHHHEDHAREVGFATGRWGMKKQDSVPWSCCGIIIYAIIILNSNYRRCLVPGTVW